MVGDGGGGKNQQLQAIDDKEMRGLLFQTVKLQLVLATYIKTRCQQELGKGRQRNKKHKSILEFQESYHESLKAKTLIKDSLSIAQVVLTVCITRMLPFFFKKKRVAHSSRKLNLPWGNA